MQETRPRYSVVTTLVEHHVGSLALDVDAVEAVLWLVVLASVTLDVYTTYLGLSAGLAEGNPVMRWALEQGMLVTLALNLSALVLSVVLFYGIKFAVTIARPPGDRFIAVLTELWLAGLVAAGFLVFANNLSVIVLGESLL